MGDFGKKNVVSIVIILVIIGMSKSLDSFILAMNDSLVKICSSFVSGKNTDKYLSGVNPSSLSNDSDIEINALFVFKGE